MSKTLVVLAAGMGSRYGGLKQMDPVGPSGEFLLDYAVCDALRAGFAKVCFVIRKDMAEDFEKAVGARINAHIRVEYVYQSLMQVPSGVFVPAARKKPWGTGHAVLVTKDVVRGPFSVINADDFYGRSAIDAASAFLDEPAGDAAYAMVSYRLIDTLPLVGAVSRGVCSLDGKGYLDRIIERTGVSRTGSQVQFVSGNIPQYLSGNEPSSMNMWAFKTSLFQHLEAQFAEFLRNSGVSKDAEFYLVNVIDNLIRSGAATVRVLQSGGGWFGVTNPEDRPVVQQRIASLVEQGVYPRELWA